MDIKALLGDQYRADMTVQELTAALESVELPGEKSLKKANNDLSREAAQAKRDSKAKDAEIEDLQRQMTALQRENSINRHAASFAGMGYEREAALASATALADGDFAALMEQQSRFLQGYQAKVKAELMQQTPGPAVGAGSPKTDYQRQIQAAQSAGDFAAAAYYTRLAGQQA